MSVERAPDTTGSLTTARSVGWFSIVVVAVIALLRLAGGLLHVTLFTSVAASWIEMKTITVLCFLLSAGALTLIYMRPAGSRRSSGAMLLADVVALVGLLTIADYLSQLVAGHALFVTQAPFLGLFFAAHTRMALMTGIIFTLVGFALMLLAGGSRRGAGLGHVLALPAATASYIVPLSYLLGVQTMSAVLGTPMALNTGIALCFLCLAVFCARTDTWLTGTFTGDEAGAFMARRLLPALMATPLVVGWFRLQGERIGWFSSEVGVALVASTYTIVFVILVWLAARAGNRTDKRRRVAERATSESAERLNLAQEIAHLGSWQLDLVSNCLTWSDEVYRIFGLKPQEFGATYEAFLAAVHPDDRAAVDAAYSNSVRGNRDGYEIEHRVVRKDTGEVRVVQERCRHSRDASGRIIRSVGMVHDISERKNAEEALARTRELQDRMSRMARMGAWEYDVATGKQTWTDETYRVHDVEKETYDPNAAAEISRFTPEWAPVMGKAFEDAVKLGVPYDLEAEMITVKGNRKWVRAMGSPVLDGKRIRAVSGTVQDITERKQAEAALRKSEERLRKLYAAMNEGLALHDLVYGDKGKATDYRMVDVNPTFEAITGISRAKAVGRLASELYGTGSPPYIDIYAKVAESGEPTVFETEFAPMAKCFHISVFSPSKGVFATVFSDITERKQTEHKLAEQALMLATANDAIIGYDAGYRVTFWNQGAEQMYGYGEAEAMGKVSSELLHPVYVGITREQLVERLARDGHVETESTRTTRDGRQISVEAHVIALRDEQGRTTGFVSVDRDITERKQAEQELKEAKESLEVRVRERTAALRAEIEERRRAEERLAASSQYSRSLIESSLDPLVTINAEGRITDVNEATIKATGATRVELVGSDFSEYFTEPDKAREGYRQVFARGFVTDYPLTIRHHGGHLTDVLYNATVYRDAAGRALGVFAAARDVTERKRAESLVEAERQRLRDVLNMLPAYVVLLAPDYTVPFANRFFEERFGKSFGRRCFDYLFHRTEPCENCESYKVMKTKGPHHWEWLGPDGRNYDIHDSPFRDVDGSPLIMEVGLDITERKRAEDALQKAHDTLEVKVDERTAELKRSNEELEQFAYVASHDLQEPLRMVASYVQLLGQRYKGQLDEKADRYIAHASDGAVRMSQLVNDLLSLSRVGTRAAPMEPISLPHIVAQAQDNLAAAIYQAGAEIEVGPLPTVSGDETQLTQLFQNLIDNAIKFHGPEPPLIRIDTETGGREDTGTRGRGDAERGLESDLTTKPPRHQESPDDSTAEAQSRQGSEHSIPSESAESAKSADIRSGLPGSLDPSISRSLDRFVTIRVIDNGIGIDPKYADRIFGLFKRLHSDKEYPGTGIGLAVCKKIVERHGGTIWVESEPGKGSTFVLTLPAADAGIGAKAVKST